MHARRYPLFVVAMGVLLAPLARGQGAAPAPQTAPAPVPTAAMPDVPAPEPAPPTPAPPPDPNAGATPPEGQPGASPAPPPSPAPSATPTVVPPPAAPMPAGPLGTQIATPGDTRAEGAPGSPPPPTGPGLGIELGVGMAAGGRFVDDEVASQRTVEEAVDSTYGLAVWGGSRRAVFGLALERTGLGRDHYATNTAGETMTARYGADALSLLGRWYLADTRPAVFLGVAIGAAFGTVRATGTHAPDGVFVTPGESYECSDTGPVGGTASLSAGAEFEITKGLAVVSDVRATGFLLSGSSNAFGGCGPGTGSALVGVLRLGASYRFDL